MENLPGLRINSRLVETESGMDRKKRGRAREEDRNDSDLTSTASKEGSPVWRHCLYKSGLELSRAVTMI